MQQRERKTVYSLCFSPFAGIIILWRRGLSVVKHQSEKNQDINKADKEQLSGLSYSLRLLVIVFIQITGKKRLALSQG